MLDELLMRDVQALSLVEVEEECKELEDAYAEALMDNASADALSQLWKRIRELHGAMRDDGNNTRHRLIRF